MTLSNTIIVAYRNRHQQLRCFLDSLELPEGQHLAIVDLGSTDESAEVIASHRHRLSIEHFQIPYTGVFWKTKALNHALKRATTEYVSIVDVDTICLPDFWAGVGTYLAERPELPKLSYRIYRYAFPQVRHLVFEYRPDWYGRFLREFVANPSRYPNPCYETYQSFRTGNSHFTMRRADLLAVGGLNEAYVGYGYEDHDLNMRLHKVYGPTRIYDIPMFQVGHERYETSWYTDELSNANRARFMAEEAKGFPTIPLPADFGEFPKGVPAPICEQINTDPANQYLQAVPRNRSEYVIV